MRRRLLRIGWALAAVAAALPLAWLYRSVYDYVRAMEELHAWMEESGRSQSDLVLDPAFDRVHTSPGGRSYAVNHSVARFALDVEPGDEHCTVGFPSHAAALQYAKAHGLPLLPSVFCVQSRSKALTDRVVAALERSSAKRAFLLRLHDAMRRLCHGVPKPGDVPDTHYLRGAVSYVDAALYFDGAPMPDAIEPVDPTRAIQLASHFESFVEGFRDEPPWRGTPVGVYAETPDLARAFRRDRFLALPRSSELGLALAWVIEGDPSLRADFARLAACERAIAGPPQTPGPAELAELVRDVPPATLLHWDGPPEELLARTPRTFALFGRASSPDDLLLARVAVSGGALMPALIAALRSGTIDIAPRPGDGWYQYQLHALETLVASGRCEAADKLVPSPAYQRRLERAFAVAIAGERESFVRFLTPVLGGPGAVDSRPEPIALAPALSIEPGLTFLLRHARAARFAATALRAVWGAEVDAIRLGNEPMLEALADEARLCYGLYLTSCEDLGSTPRGLLEGELPADTRLAAIARAKAWLADPASDPELGADTRAAVPVSAVPGRPLVCWATTGVRLERLRIEYGTFPRVTGPVQPTFVPAFVYSPGEDFVELRLPTGSSPPTRAEFRAHCDAVGGDPARLRERLEGSVAAAAPVPARASWLWPLILCVAGPWLVATGWRHGRRLPVVLFKLGVVAVLATEVSAWVLYRTNDRFRAELALRHLAPLNGAWSTWVEMTITATPLATRLDALESAMASPHADVRATAMSCALGGKVDGDDPRAFSIVASTLEGDDDEWVARRAMCVVQYHSTRVDYAAYLDRALERHPDLQRLYVDTCLDRAHPDTWRRALRLLDRRERRVTVEVLDGLLGRTFVATTPRHAWEVSRAFVASMLGECQAQHPARIECLLDQVDALEPSTWTGYGSDTLHELLVMIGSDRARRALERGLNKTDRSGQAAIRAALERLPRPR